MMKIINRFLPSTMFVLLCCLNSFAAKAAGQDNYAILDSGKIENQLSYVIDKASNYEDYKVIKNMWLNKLKRNLSDTLGLQRGKIAEQNLIMAKKVNEADSLISLLKQSGDELDIAIKNRNGISFFGIQFSKNAYNGIVWTIICALAFCLAIIWGLFSKSNKETVQVKSDLDDKKLEFEEHRKRALKREEELARKYHDEINKYKNKYGKV